MFDVCWAVRMVIWRAQQASKSSVVGMPAMMYINRREFGNHTNEKPFKARQTKKTMIKYSEQWLQIIRYIWRTHAMPAVEPRKEEEESTVDNRRPRYQVTAQQDMALEKI